MTDRQPDPVPLSARIAALGGAGRFLSDGDRTARFLTVAAAARDLRFAGRSALLRTPDQLSSALALIALDGMARRIVIAPPDLDDALLDDVISRAEVSVVVHGADVDGRLDARFAEGVRTPPPATAASEWVLFTSGTSGAPKMVIHTLDGLTGAIRPTDEREPVWATFYDIRRYGGLQMLLRAAVAGGSIVLSRAGEPTGMFLRRARSLRVTHLTGTPSHWRQALRCSELDALRLRYARLSGEIADQGLLDRMKSRLSGIPIGHAYASTEAGVVFEVNDGREGFPRAFLDRTPPHPEMRVVDGALQVRSARTALNYLGEPLTLRDADGFVDSGDMVAVDGDRCRFLGRRGGVVNVGGLKVHPEEVEQVVARHPKVRACVARPRRNPITGSVVAVEVVAEDGADAASLQSEILDLCRSALAPHKVPATVRVIDNLAVSAAGKVERADA